MSTIQKAAEAFVLATADDGEEVGGKEYIADNTYIVSGRPQQPIDSS